MSTHPHVVRDGAQFSILELIADRLGKPSGPIVSHLLSRVFNRSSAAINRTAMQLLDLQPADRVIEVGFGGGGLLEQMAEATTHGLVAGVDYSPEMVSLCRHRLRRHIDDGRVQLRCADASSLPYDSGVFTKACTVNTIYFWRQPLTPLSELRRVLRDGGTAVLGFSPRATLEKLPFTGRGFVAYEPDQVTALLKQAGFAPIRTASSSGRLGEFVCVLARKET